MGKKYKYNEIKPQERMVSEPAIGYEEANDENYAYFFSAQELRERAWAANTIEDSRSFLLS
ncbi:MAG: hypothetical protein LIP06_10670 [Tannerellaceae bacterium]|nr:hypothetical protein [Tannerellaceae bacterium]